MAESERRLTDLEVRYSYLERTLSELDEVVIELRKRLERAEREVGRLREMLHEGPSDNPPNEKPPHY